MDPLRLVEHVHGHVGWLAAAILLHPAIVLRDRRRRADVAVATATGFTTLASAAGAWLYVAYRESLRREIFLASRATGLLFERKEHLAYGALVLAWAGAAAYVGALRAEGSVRESLRSIAFRAYVGAAALAVIVAALGTWVAAFRSF